MLPSPRLRFQGARIAALTCLAVSASLLSCGGGDGPSEPPPPPTPVVVTRVVIAGAPGDGLVLRPTPIQLSATAQTAAGAVVDTAVISWSTSNPLVLSVSSTGSVSGVALGTAQITARSGTVSASVTLTVREVVVPPASGATTPTTAVVANNALEFTVPPNAVPAGVPRLTVGLPSSTSGIPRLVPGTAFDFGPSGTVLGTPITVAFRYDAGSVPMAERATLRVVRVEGANLVPVPSTSDAATAVVTAQLSRFSTYAVVRRADPATAAIVAGNGQSATVGTAVAVAPRLVVRDADGAPVPAVPIQFSVIAGGGSITGSATATTNDNGEAALAGTWVLGATPGENRLQALALQGSNPTVTFTATAVAPPAPTIGLAPTALSFAGAVGAAAPVPQQVAVTNTTPAAGALTGLAVGTISYGAGASGWLSAALGGSSAPTTLTVTPSVTGLSAGVYTATVPVTSTVSGVAAASVSVTLTVSPGAPTQLGVATQPTTATSGVTLSPAPTVEIRDASGARVTSTASVTASIESGSGTLLGTTTVAAVNGTATFADLRLAGSGAHVLRFTSSGLTSALSAPIAVTQVATALTILTQPDGAVSGVPFSAQPVVRIVDAAGVVVSNSTLAVTVVVASGTGTLSGTTTVNAVAGVATFSGLTLTGSGAHMLRFSTTSPALSVTSASFTIASLPATQLGIVTAPSAAATSGVPFATQPVIAVRDANGGTVVTSVAVTATVVSGSGTLVGTTTVNAVNGIATFTNLQLNGSGAHTLRFSSAGLTSVDAPTVTVTQVASALQVQVAPSGAVSGVPFSTQPVVRVVDGAGLVMASAAFNVTAEVASGSGVLGGTATVAMVSGVATFANLSITGTGAHVLRFTTTTPALAVLSPSFTVTAGAPTQLALTQQPSATAVSGTVFATQPVVQIRDASGVLVPTGTAVTASIGSGSGTLLGTTTVAAVDGVVTFTNLRIAGGGPHTIAFAASGLTGVTSGTVTVSQVATSLEVATAPNGAVSGSPFLSQPVIRVLDAAGAVVTTGAGATLTVTATIASGAGTLGGTTAVAAVAGVATFSNLSITGAGAHSLRFATSSPALEVVSSVFTVGSAPPTQLALVTPPSASATSGVPFATQPVVEVRDAGGTKVSTSVSVTVALFSGSGTLVGTTTVASVDGTATFAGLQINGSGAHVLRFTSSGLTGVDGPTITVSQVAASLSVLTQPAGATSGSAFGTQPVLQILDNAGLLVTTGTGATLTVTATKQSGPGTLGGTTGVAAVGGVAAFGNLSITGAGAHTLQFTTASPALSVNSASFTVAAAPPTQLVLTTNPSASATSGVPFATQPVVEIRDATNTKVSSTANVTVAIFSGTGSLVGTATVAAVDGVATFAGLQLNGSGAHVLRFSSSGLTSVDAPTITVNQVAASLSVFTQPAGATSGSPFSTQPVVRILDNAGLLVTTGSGATLTVTAAKQSGPGTLAGTTGIAAVGGVATFTNLSITGVGAHTLQFTTSSPALSVNSASFNVAAAPPTQLVLTTNPSASATSGVPFATQPVVEIRDATNTKVSSTASVTVAILSGSGALVGTATVAAVDGVATFAGLQLNGAGAHVLRFTSPSLSSVDSPTITVSQVAASLSIFTQPAGATSGSPFSTQPVVRILDNAGLLVTTGSGATLTVTAAKQSGPGTLAGSTGIAAVGGVATFTNLSITGTGAHTLQFTTVSPALSANSASFNVAAAPPTQLVLTTAPSASATSGVPFATQPVVEIRDATNTKVSSTANVTVAVFSGSGALVGTATVAAVDGVATFAGLQLNGAGAHVLRFTSPSLSSVDSPTITVSQVAASLSVFTQPAGATSGSPFGTQPVVRILDNAGLLVTTGPGATLTVTAAKQAGPGTLAGTTGIVAVGGVATFTNLSITGAGAHTLQFTTSSPALSVNSAEFTVGAAAATQLVLTTNPSASATSGIPFATQPVVEIRDGSNTKVSSTASVTVAVFSGGGSLVGTATVAAVDGVATFAGLQINGGGAHVLRFTSPGLSSADSPTITVTQVATSLQVQTQPSGATTGAPFTTQPVVHILDNAGVLVTTGSGATLQVTAAKQTGGGTLSGTTAVNAVGGVVTYAGLTITGTGSHSLQFTTVTPALAVTSNTFNVQAAGGVITTIEVTVPQPSVSGNATQTATAVARDGNGDPVAATFTWSVSDPQVVRVVGATGALQALGAGSSQITATVGDVSGSSPLTVSSSAGNFNIELRNLTAVSGSVQAALNAAVARWQDIIRGDLADFNAVGLNVDFCGNQPEGTTITEVIDDLLIFVKVEAIDGPGQVLGSAGPCWIRGGAGGLPFVGVMRFDIADIPTMELNGTLSGVILHEMGHVLGVGTMWGDFLEDPAPALASPACLSSDPIFTGTNARWAFGNLGTAYGGRTVPVENCFGDGTRNAHWRESVVDRELMTGFIDATNPLSPLTILSLLDLGYVVDNSTRDSPPWFDRGPSTVRMQMIEAPPPTPRIAWGSGGNGRE